MTRATFLCLILTALLLPGHSFGDDVIDEAQAMRLAEAYVRANGYTDAPPSVPAGKLEPESFERTAPDTWLTERAGLLEPQAFACKRGSRSDLDQGWNILFRIKKIPPYKIKPTESAYAKAVEMDRYGKQLIVLHGIVIAYGKPVFPTYTLRSDSKPPHP